MENVNDTHSNRPHSFLCSQVALREVNIKNRLVNIKKKNEQQTRKKIPRNQTRKSTRIIKNTRTATITKSSKTFIKRTIIPCKVSTTTKSRREK